MALSIAFLIPLWYVAMAHHMGFPLPDFAKEYLANGIIQGGFLLPIFVLCYRMPVNGWRALIRRMPNMDSLVAVGVTASLAYSAVSLIRGEGDYYFEAAGMILALISLGKHIEARAKKRTASAVEKIIRLAVPEATVIREGKEQRIAAEDVKVGDIVVVATGERCAVDGTVTEGGGAFDESAVTGEGLPADKTAGDRIISGSINLTGRVLVKAELVGEDTTVNRIIRLMEHAAAAKAPIARIADKVSGVFVPTVMGLSLMTALIWLLIGDGEAAFSHAVSVMVVSCPCALGLATPSAITVGLGSAAEKGILFKDAAAMETAGKVELLALDKTGTLTKGTPVVTDTVGDIESVAYAVESLSSHPVAKAVCSAYAEAPRLVGTDFKSYAGRGVSAVVDGKICYAGNRKFMEECGIDLGDYEKNIAKFEADGKTLLIFGGDGKCFGVCAVADSLRDEAAETVAAVKLWGIEPIMLTGDNKNAAEYMAVKAGIDECHGGLLPQDKAAYIEEKEASGKITAMVGDGVNDAPALVTASLGISVMGSSDIAADAADVVLMEPGIGRVAESIRVGKKTLRVIKQNLFWALIYNVILIPVAAGAFAVVGFVITPSVSAAAMSVSSLTVVSNALRLKRLLK